MSSYYRFDIKKSMFDWINFVLLPFVVKKVTLLLFKKYYTLKLGTFHCDLRI